jgi:hypothetical protein
MRPGNSTISNDRLRRGILVTYSGVKEEVNDTGTEPRIVFVGGQRQLSRKRGLE